MAEYRRYVKLIAAIHTANPDTAKAKQVIGLKGGEQ
jgi:hypothetical protein